MCVNNSHWITVSNMPFKKESNYDSLTPGSISDSLVHVVCSSFKCNSKTDTLHFDIMDVQWQRNDYDCGVFAIAYAMELAHGGDPALYNWDCTSMRSHLVNCLEQRKLDSFPKSEKKGPLGLAEES